MNLKAEDVKIAVPEVRFKTERGEVVVDTVFPSVFRYAFGGYFVDFPDAPKLWAWGGLVRDDLKLNLDDDKSDEGRAKLEALQQISKKLCELYGFPFSPT